MNEDAADMLRGRLATTLVICGLAAGAVQVLLFRALLVACHGDEVITGLMLAGWLLWGALGAALVGRGKLPLELSVRRLVGLCHGYLLVPAASLVVAYASTPALLHLGGRLQQSGPPAGGLMSLVPGEMLSLPQIALLAAVGTLLPGLLNGALFAAAMRPYVQVRALASSSVGGAYALDAVGHLLGGTVLAWLALRWVEPLIMLALVGLAVAGAAVALELALPRVGPIRWLRGPVLALALAALVLTPGARELLRQLPYPPGQEVLDATRTVFGDLVLTRWGETGSYLYYNGLPVAGSPAPEWLEMEVDFALLQHPRPQRVLVIGGGVFGGLAAVLRHDPEQVDFLELDPALPAFAKAYLSPADRAALADPRVRFLPEEARRFVKHRAGGEGAEGYDVVLALLPAPSSAFLNRFYSARWYEDAARLLAPGGVLAWQMPSSDTYLEGLLRRLNALLLNTSATALPAQALLPGETMVVASSRRGEYLSESGPELIRRARERGLDPAILEAWLPNALEEYRVGYVRGQVDLAKERLNSDEQPLAYFLHQAWWLEHQQPGWGLRLAGRAGLSPWPLYGAVALVLLLGGLGARRRGLTGLAPAAVFAAGLGGMGAEVLLLYSFQSYYGYVFHQIGLVVGCFMVGLAIGALGAARGLDSAVSARWVGRRLGGLLQGGGLFLAGTAPLLQAVWSASGSRPAEALVAHLLFPLLAAAYGAWVGALFPLASHLWGADREQRPRAAALLYAADLSGAAVGALLMGTLLVPVLGNAGAGALVALPALALGLLAWLTARAGGS